MLIKPSNLYQHQLTELLGMNSNHSIHWHILHRAAHLSSLFSCVLTWDHEIQVRKAFIIQIRQGLAPSVYVVGGCMDSQCHCRIRGLIIRRWTLI
jgi:hypothetical protein